MVKKYLWLDGEDFWVVKTTAKKLILYRREADAVWYMRQWPGCTAIHYAAEKFVP